MTKPLIDMPVMGGFEKPQSIENQKKDEDYNKPLNKPLSETKDELKSLFGSFNAEKDIKDKYEESDVLDTMYTGNIEQETNKEVEKKSLEKFSENPSSPVLDRFTNIPGINISNSDKMKISEAMGEQKMLSGGDVLLNLQNGIKDLEFENPMMKDYLSVYITQTTEMNSSLDNKGKKLENGGEVKVEIPEDFNQNAELSKIVTENPEDKTLQLLASNYIKFPDGAEGSQNVDKDIDTAFQITVNKIIDGKQFTRNESFTDAMEDIKTGDIELQFKALKYINSLVQTTEGKSGKKDVKSFNKIKGEHIESKQNYLDFKIDQLEKQIEGMKEGKEKIKLNIELEKLEKQRDVDDFKGDVFESGKIDKGSEGNEKEPAN